MPSPLLTALDCEGHVHLIVGTNPLASTRCAKSLGTGATPIVIAPADATVHYVLKNRIDDGEVKWLKRDFEDTDMTTLGRDEVDNVVDAVFVTSGGKHSFSTHISNLCRRKRIPVNVVDAPNLCTFTLLATHSDGPLHIGVTTSGKGCKLASRIRREIASSLPPKFGEAVERLGTTRSRIWEEDYRTYQSDETPKDVEDDDAHAQRPNFNRLISDFDHDAARTRRMRWLSQICEYWPLSRLASITDADIDIILQSYATSHDLVPPSLDAASIDGRHQPKPHIFLAGSGPGSPSLLTLATHRAIQNASIILADKLVPAAVLDLIPRRTQVHIARKFPGNAEVAQEELLSLGLEALRKGHTVLRLKQGDPYIYGRGAEEFAYFQDKGFTPIVLPGITSALSAPLFAAIPPTHRNVADQVLVCTGTGRKGAAPEPPLYVPTQTVVFLMALHRLSSLIDALTGSASKLELGDQAQKPRPEPWPRATPCAVVERASCPDQRVIRSTLQHVCAAVEEEGSRPPGLLVVGWSCEVLKKPEGPTRWIVEEGFAGFDTLDQGPVAVDEVIKASQVEDVLNSSLLPND
ncbi:uroporphyrin-III C-methyltransferase [Lecanora helva]